MPGALPGPAPLTGIGGVVPLQGHQGGHLVLAGIGRASRTRAVATAAAPTPHLHFLATEAATPPLATAVVMDAVRLVKLVKDLRQ